MRFKLSVQELFETAITVRPPQPFGSRKGVLLVGRSSCGWEGPAPERRIDLRDHGAVGRRTPAVERPEMHAIFGVLPDVAQPRDACLCGLRHRPLYIKMEDRLGCSCSQFGQRTVNYWRVFFDNGKESSLGIIKNRSDLRLVSCPHTEGEPGFTPSRSTME